MQKPLLLEDIINIAKLAKEFYDKQNNDQALAHYLQAAKLFLEYFSHLETDKPEQIDSPVGATFAHTHLATCYYAAGLCYSNLRRHEEAAPYLYASLVIANKIKTQLNLRTIEKKILHAEIYCSEKTPFPSPSQYWINIPQGCTGHLLKHVNYLQLAGLYTDKFTTCLIVIMKSASRISMSHVDHMQDSQNITHLTHLLEEYLWACRVDGQCELIIVHKQEGIMLDELTRFFNHAHNVHHDKPFYRNINVQTIKVPKDTGYVTVSFSEGIRLSKSKTEPLNLLTPPNNFELESARTIELFLYMSTERATPMKVIFNGRTWTPIAPDQLQPRDDQKLLACIRDTDPNKATVLKISAILEKIKKEKKGKIVFEGPEIDTCVVTARYLRRHLTKYDHKRIFCEDMSELLSDCQKNYPLTSADHSIVQKIKKALENPDTAARECQDIIAPLGEGAGACQLQLVSDCRAHLILYVDMQREKRRIYQAQERCAKADGLINHAIKCISINKYIAAKNLFLKAFQLLTHSVTRDNLQLILACESVGKCCFILKEYPQACEFFNFAFALLTLHHPDRKADLKRLQQFIENCEALSNVKVERDGDYLLSRLDP